MRRTIRTLLLSLSLAAAAAPAVPVAAAASPRLSVSPTAGHLSTEPGRTAEEKVTLVNLSDETLQVSATLGDLEIDPQGTLAARPPGTTARSAAAWAFLDPPSIVLPGGNSRTVTVAVTPPAGVAAGGYAASVRFAFTDGSGRTRESVHAALVEVGGEGLVRAASLVRLSVAARTFGSTFPVTLTIENTGNVHLFATGRIVVRDAFDRITATLPIARTPILPGHSRVISMEAPAPIVPWRVRVRVEVGFGPGVPVGSEASEAYAFAWPSVGVVLLLALLLLATAVRIARRLVRRIRRRRGSALVFPEAEPIPEAEAWDPARRATPSALRPVIVAASEPEPASEPEAASEPEPSGFEPPRVIRLEPEADRAWLADLMPEPEAEPVPEPEREPVAEIEPEPDVESEPEPEAEPARIIHLEPETARVVDLASEPAREAEPEPARFAAAASDDLGIGGPTRIPRERVVESASPLTSGAAVRRAMVARDLLAAGAGRSGERVEVGLEILRSVGEEPEVSRLVGEAYEAAEGAAGADTLAPLALALAAVGSDRAPEALLRAFVSPPKPLVEPLRAALRACDPEALRAHPELLAALPRQRRASLHLD